MSADAGCQELVEERRIIVCVGTGGVGKTTVAAALAVQGARAGRRSLVITIDPARRLADALGVARLGNQASALPAEALTELGIHGAGRLSALMLDMKRTFDDLVERFAESPEVRDRILRNRIYQHVSDALAGSAEYAAMEKVFELCESDAFDLIVVDTPPSQHALDFLEAPQRLLEFLDSRIVHVLLHPAFAAGRFGFRLFHRAAARALQMLERVSGFSFLEDISEFLMAFENMSEGFAERAKRVRSLLLGADAGFVLIAGPSPESASSAELFLERLTQMGAPVAGVVINRMQIWPGLGLPRAPAALRDGRNLQADTRLLAAALARAGTPAGCEHDAARAAVDAATGYASAAELDLRSIERLQRFAQRDGNFFRCVPEFPRDVHDLRGLMQLRRFLFEEGKAPDPASGGER